MLKIENFAKDSILNDNFKCYLSKKQLIIKERYMYKKKHKTAIFFKIFRKKLFLKSSVF